MTDTTQKMLPKQLAKLIRDHTNAQLAMALGDFEEISVLAEEAKLAQRRLEEGFKLVTGYEAIFPTLRD